MHSLISYSGVDLATEALTNEYNTLVNQAATGHDSLVCKMQDILVLSCCRSVDPADKGMLLRSFTDASGRNIGECTLSALRKNSHNTANDTKALLISGAYVWLKQWLHSDQRMQLLVSVHGGG